MKTKQRKHKKSAQDVQDEIFRKMSADKKMELWADFWRLAQDLVSGKKNYGTNRSKRTSYSRR